MMNGLYFWGQRKSLQHHVCHICERQWNLVTKVKSLWPCEHNTVSLLFLSNLATNLGLKDQLVSFLRSKVTAMLRIVILHDIVIFGLCQRGIRKNNPVSKCPNRLLCFKFKLFADMHPTSHITQYTLLPLLKQKDLLSQSNWYCHINVNLMPTITLFNLVFPSIQEPYHTLHHLYSTICLI